MEGNLQSVRAMIHGETLSVLDDGLLPLSSKGQSIPGVCVLHASLPSGGSSFGQAFVRPGSLPYSVSLCEFATQLPENFVDSEQ